jgi:CarD family transcriptional regulator, regulator of rRNA transcription
MSTRTKSKTAPAKASAGKTAAKSASAKAKPVAAKKKPVAAKPAPKAPSSIKPKVKEAPKAAAAKPTAKPAHHAHPAHPAHPAKPAHAPVKSAPAPAKPAPHAAPAAAAKPTAAAPMKPVMGKPVLVKPLPAKPAKPLEDVSFRAGDHVVYPTHGVGKVLGIESQEISGHSLQVITVHFEKDRMTLRVPVSKARNSGLRRLSSRKIMDTALQTLKGRSRVKRTMWSRRAQEYEAKINSGDPVSIAEVVRDLHRNADQPDQSYSERQIYQAALDRLVRELAAVEDIDEQSATQRLEQLLKAA